MRYFICLAVFVMFSEGLSTLDINKLKYLDRGYIALLIRTIVYYQQQQKANAIGCY